MEKITVGYLNDSYPYKRNIINIIKNVNYIKVTDLFKISSLGLKILHKLKFRKNNDLLTFLNFSFNDLNKNKVDILHFFNNVSYGSTPWISTFETFIPRYPALLNHQENGILVDNKVSKALKAMANDSCKKIIAISECTSNFQKELLKNYPDYKIDIEKKLCVIHPPQQLFIKDFEEKNLNFNDEISFIFVGRDFFRKGGLEILKAFKKVKETYDFSIKLTIISSLGNNDYATRAGKKEFDRSVEIIKENENWINYFNELSNEEALNMMKHHHIGLLPTWADTYGYSVLEMQACGCPVISTDVRSLPEINDEKNGWVIKVPKNHLGEALYVTEEQRNNLRSIIEKGLEDIIVDIFNNPHVIKEKSQNAINNIMNNHSPEKYAIKLEKIYEECKKNSVQ